MVRDAEHAPRIGRRDFPFEVGVLTIRAMNSAHAPATSTNPDNPDEMNGWGPEGGVQSPFHLLNWVMANRAHFKPPVANKYLYSGRDFFVMIIVGPNARNDFHQVDSEEFFLQIKGDIIVKTIENGCVRNNIVKEGEVFFIPPNVIHSPQRGPDTIGLVVERRRPEGEPEHIMFFCEKCEALVYDKVFNCKDIVVHFARAMHEFWADTALCTCKKCGHVITKPPM
ncbi:MAG: 3-hydroxyanthranilate 3,4-dioxygenase [Phycisphaerales bacterium]|nr:3-hydroxyanthranilate 3,4-dioxygenase [Phycisphaerales bacterium]